jgi:predicted NBD/HSP70 family sugar kinase
MRSINRSAVLEYLRLAKTASRTELSSQLQISKPTVMRIIDELMDCGLVRATGQIENGLGRSRELLALDVQNNLVIGVELGSSAVSGIVATLGGEILCRARSEAVWSGEEDGLRELAGCIHELRGLAQKQPGKVLGIAVCVPGIIDRTAGVVKVAPCLSWQDYPLLEKLQPAFDLPITIENDVNLAALGEHWFGAGVGADHLVWITIDTGVGAGIILDGKLFRGHRDSSGEIGYLLPSVQYLDRPYPGFGALESIASGPGIVARGLAAVHAQFPDRPMAALTPAAIFQAAQNGETWAGDIVRQTVDMLSLAVANVSVCFDPEVIIVGGSVAESSDGLIPAIQARLGGVIPFVPRIQKTTLGKDAALLGCVVRVFQETTEYAAVHSA